MCNKVEVIYKKSEELRKLKYDTPKEARDETQVDFLIQDIQTLCREIGFDRGEYNK